MNDSNLIKLQHFFEVDLRIKKELYNNVPPNGYTDKDTICKYTDHLEDSLIYIFSELKCVALDVFNNNSQVLKRINQLEKSIKNEFYLCGLDINKLRNFYNKCISYMNPSFIDSVKENCVGYASFYGINIDTANTINELLHYIHSYILNNHTILQSIPKINEKKNIYNYPISLRGNSIEVFNRIFEMFPNDLDVGWTDMVCLDERKLLMMVRDRGHALTIEVTLNNDKARLEYFIPKLCNIDMINALEGVNKVNENSIGATGVIETNINNLPQKLFEFISMVPTDADMIINR